MRIMLKFEDLTHEGRQLYGRGKFDQIGFEHVRSAVPQNVLRSADFVSLYLPDETGKILKDRNHVTQG